MITAIITSQNHTNLPVETISPTLENTGLDETTKPWALFKNICIATGYSDDRFIFCYLPETGRSTNYFLNNIRVC